MSEAIQTNISGTVNIADLAVKYRVSRMVMISAANARHPEMLWNIVSVWRKYMCNHLIAG